jgi:hypothetical protein
MISLHTLISYGYLAILVFTTGTEIFLRKDGIINFKGM